MCFLSSLTSLWFIYRRENEALCCGSFFSFMFLCFCVICSFFYRVWSIPQSVKALKLLSLFQTHADTLTAAGDLIWLHLALVWWFASMLVRETRLWRLTKACTLPSDLRSVCVWSGNSKMIIALRSTLMCFSYSEWFGGWNHANRPNELKLNQTAAQSQNFCQSVSIKILLLPFSVGLFVLFFFFLMLVSSERNLLLILFSGWRTFKHQGY